MHLFETEDGDIWVCVNCGREREEEIRAKDWEYIFDKDDPVLRCKLCGGPDYDVEDQEPFSRGEYGSFSRQNFASTSGLAMVTSIQC